MALSVTTTLVLHIWSCHLTASEVYMAKPDFGPNDRHPNYLKEKVTKVETASSSAKVVNYF